MEMHESNIHEPITAQELSDAVHGVVVKVIGALQVHAAWLYAADRFQQSRAQKLDGDIRGTNK
jgi:hypothetical protein